MNKNSIKFSIIIRIYNAESNLSQQIDSIISQTYSNWELILVNDGSTDSSGLICDNYAMKNKKISVIHQKNSGCACATVMGLKKASGDFCLAIDADDWVDNNLLETANYYLTKDMSDILVYGIRYIKNGVIYKTLSLVTEETNFSKEEFLKLTWSSTVHSLCLKFIRRDSLRFKAEEESFLTQNKINQNEDMLISIPYILSSKKIKVIPNCMYNYVLYDDSMSHGIDTIKKITEAFSTCSAAVRFMNLREARYSEFVVSELYREIFPFLPSVLFRKNINRKMIKELKKTEIYRYTKMKDGLKYGAKCLIAWVLFRIM